MNNLSYIIAETTFTKRTLTFGTIPGSCQSSVRRLWAFPAVVQWGWGRDWKMESGQEQQRLGGSPLLLPSGWKVGHSRCTDCGTGGTQQKDNKIWQFQLFQEELNSQFKVQLSFYTNDLQTHLPHMPQLLCNKSNLHENLNIQFFLKLFKRGVDWY